MRTITCFASLCLLVLLAFRAPAAQPTYNYSDKTVTELVTLLENTNSVVRHCAAIFIGDRYRNPKAPLVNGPIRKPHSPDPELPIPRRVIPALTTHLKDDPDWAVRVCSLDALRDLRFRTNTTPLVALGLEDKDTLLRIRSCSALIDISHDYLEPLHTNAIPTLIGCLEPKGEVESVWQAAYAAGGLGTNGAALVPSLQVLMKNDSEKVRHYAERALSQIQPATQK